jgi:hypothetical protein
MLRNSEEWMFSCQVRNQSVEKGAGPWRGLAGDLLVEADEALVGEGGFGLEDLHAGAHADEHGGALDLAGLVEHALGSGLRSGLGGDGIDLGEGGGGVHGRSPGRMLGGRLGAVFRGLSALAVSERGGHDPAAAGPPQGGWGPLGSEHTQ